MFAHLLTDYAEQSPRSIPRNSPFIPQSDARLSLHNAPRQEDCVRVGISAHSGWPAPCPASFAEVNPGVVEHHNRAIRDARCSLDGRVGRMRGGAHLFGKVLQIRRSVGRSHNATTPLARSGPRARHSCAAFAKGTLGGATLPIKPSTIESLVYGGTAINNIAKTTGAPYTCIFLL